MWAGALELAWQPCWGWSGACGRRPLLCWIRSGGGLAIYSIIAVWAHSLRQHALVFWAHAPCTPSLLQDRLRRLAPEARAKELERQQRIKQKRALSKMVKKA